MKTSEVLNKAADVIERDGWHQGGYSPDATKDGTPTTGHPVCAMGAIHDAGGAVMRWNNDLGCWAGPFDTPIVDKAGDLLGAHVDDFVPHWNDTPGRTKDEVVAAMRAAALIEAAREDQDAAFATYACCIHCDSPNDDGHGVACPRGCEQVSA